ncbi:helix-turn-helix transcriptional regulator [Gilvimarinus agarilyticus]|uniref:helix-turn-helix transcriptional regulator n=1 Tax=unclassified Gilvimarinus TaxID=2642066 RepID=UPI001C08984A|nr:MULTISPECIES: helix-turn-helix transcriptional regulator [unclassified Gilvimarinus]MBU2886682.1 helix-turn-helix transcriptional regulator [Gilvimarinus agarilyticus]MDO6571350.1 helix-turn-helix transcriptional regulator [Gilvimarinus sp. 2_MG-2023]MDO6746234.1 helix-turn-helix transcriptional regulator [Gilvimarinus sp. 1_MG-2023]
MLAWIEREERYVPAHQFPAVIIELAQSRNTDMDKLLRGTGVFWEDYLSGELILKPDQCLQLITNLRRLLPGNDIPYLLGHRLYPGNFGASINPVWFASHLSEAIDHFVLCQASLSPLLHIRKSVDPDYLYLHWQNNITDTEHFHFLLQLSMTAITSLLNHLCEAEPSWDYLLPGPLDNEEQYQVNFGSRVFANQHIAAMRVPRSQLSTACRQANVNNAVIARNQFLAAWSQQPPLGFVAYIDQCIRTHLPHQLTLEVLAEQLCISPATLKRKLKKHDTRFQDRYDSVRKELAIDWLTRQQLTYDEIAERLHFHDIRNLRRAFKRWTGTLPSSIKPLSPAKTTP